MIAQVKSAFRKMHIDVSIIGTNDRFRDPRDILHTGLDSRVTYVRQLEKKIRFVFVMPTETCSSAALSRLD